MSSVFVEHASFSPNYCGVGNKMIFLYLNLLPIHSHLLIFHNSFSLTKKKKFTLKLVSIFFKTKFCVIIANDCFSWIPHKIQTQWKMFFSLDQNDRFYCWVRIWYKLFFWFNLLLLSELVILYQCAMFSIKILKSACEFLYLVACMCVCICMFDFILIA